MARGDTAVADRDHLADAARRLRVLANLDVTFRGKFATDRRSFTLTGLHGCRTAALRGLSIQPGAGVGGKAMAQVRPVVVDDYTRADDISHQYDRAVGAEGIRAMLAVPVRTDHGVVGVLYGGIRSTQTIGEPVLRQAVRLAREAEFRIAVDEVVDRRLAEVGPLRDDGGGLADENGVDRERLREVQAELLEIAHTTPDSSTRQRLSALSRRIVDSSERAPAPRDLNSEPTVRLSDREVDVLIQVAVGCNNAEVGRRLSILSTTVKSYLQSAMRKLDAHNRVEAVCTARRLGLIP